MEQGYTMKKTDFIELMESGIIRVPKIQREYAQGRTDEKAKEIRKHFVQDLFKAVLGTTPESHLNLDLMYGLNSKGAKGDEGRSVFLPIDGQQRLTTLYLLAWFCGIREMGDEEKRWTFDYKSRRIAQYFMSGLRNHPRRGGKPSDELEKASWFHSSWKSDPSVSGMIATLDEMYEWQKEPVAILKQSANLRNVEFYVDDEICGKNREEEAAEATYGHLFLKMNARGLPLTDWEVEKNEIDKHSKPNSTWRNNVNGVWQENIWRVIPDGGKLKERIQLLDTSMSKIVGICAEICGKPKDKNYDEWLCAIDQDKMEEFFQWCDDAFCWVETIKDTWSQDRCKNGLWKVEFAEHVADANERGEEASEKGEYAKWLTGKDAISHEQLLRFAFLIRWLKNARGSSASQGIPKRRIRILLNLLDNTDIRNKELLQSGLDYLSDGALEHLVKFHEKQLADERWKANFGEEDILKIERHPLVWRGSTAFLGKINPKEMLIALAKLKGAVQVEVDRKGLFLSLLGLSGECNADLPCGSIWLPEVERDWAKECFAAGRLFLSKGVAAWLHGCRYNAISGASAWLNHLSDLWNTLKQQGLKRIATKDAGWLFGIKNENLTNEAIRLVRSQFERERLKFIANASETDTGVLYIAWRELPYNGFMKAKEQSWFYNVKHPTWWQAPEPSHYELEKEVFVAVAPVSSVTD